MRDELRSYLQAKTYSSIGGFSGKTSFADKDQTDRLNRKLVTPALIAPLVESCYVPPEMNP